MTTLTVTLALAAPAAQADRSGAAVGEPAVTGSAAVTVNRARGAHPAGDSRAAAPDTCKPARRALRFYTKREAKWRERMGAAVPPREALQAADPPDLPGRCPQLRRQALRAQARARAARAAWERWWAERGHVIRRLDRGLRGTPMAGLGMILEREGRRRGVSPYFMAAIAATESSLGRYACRSNPRNVWGLASCVNSWPVPYFATWNEAISFFARFLAARWPGHSTPYSFRGYAACSDCWARKTSYWMGRLFGVPAVTRYP